MCLNISPFICSKFSLICKKRVGGAVKMPLIVCLFVTKYTYQAVICHNLCLSRSGIKTALLLLSCVVQPCSKYPKYPMEFQPNCFGCYSKQIVRNEGATITSALIVMLWKCSQKIAHVPNKNRLFARTACTIKINHFAFIVMLIWPQFSMEMRISFKLHYWLEVC